MTLKPRQKSRGNPWSMFRCFSGETNLIYPDCSHPRRFYNAGTDETYCNDVETEHPFPGACAIVGASFESYECLTASAQVQPIEIHNS